MLHARSHQPHPRDEKSQRLHECVRLLNATSCRSRNAGSADITSNPARFASARRSCRRPRALWLHCVATCRRARAPQQFGMRRINPTKFSFARSAFDTTFSSISDSGGAVDDSAMGISDNSSKEVAWPTKPSLPQEGGKLRDAQIVHARYRRGGVRLIVLTILPVGLHRLLQQLKAEHCSQ